MGKPRYIANFMTREMNCLLFQAGPLAREIDAILCENCANSDRYWVGTTDEIAARYSSLSGREITREEVHAQISLLHGIGRVIGTPVGKGDNVAFRIVIPGASGG